MVKKILIGLLLGILVLIIILVVSLPNIIENYIEKHDQELIGREVLIGDININYFTGGVRIKDFELKEENAETTFFKFRELYVNLELWDLMAGNYSVKEVDLIEPFVNVELLDGSFNFDNLIQSSIDTIQETSTEDTTVIQWTIAKLNLRNGALRYYDGHYRNEVKVEKLNASSPLIAWDHDTIMANVNFGLKSGGNTNIDAIVNLVDMKSAVSIAMSDINLEPLSSSLKEYIKIKDLKGMLSNDLELAVNLEETTDITVTGDIYLNEFQFTDENDENLLSFENFSIGIDSVDIKNDIYNLGLIRLDKPYVLVELYDEGDNWSRLIPETEPDSLTVETTDELLEADSYNIFALMAYYIRDIARTYATTKYKFDNLVVDDGMFQYNDFTLHEKFSYTITNLGITSKQIFSDADSIQFDINVLLNGESEGIAEIIVDPQDYNNMVINYDFYNTSLAEISPYTVYYISYPINRASLTYSCRTIINNGVIDSKNLITITGFRFGPKERSLTAYDIPVKLAVALLKDGKGNIHLDVPVEGDLKDPKFKVGKVVWGVLKNIVMKAASAPYKLLAGAFGVDENALKEINFNYLESEILKDQQKSIDAISKVLNNKPELSVEMYQLVDTLREGNAYAMLEARRKYFVEVMKNSKYEGYEFTEEELEEINTISVKDSTFMYWLDETLLIDNKYIPVQKKCRLLVGNNKVEEQVLKFIQLREQTIINKLLAEDSMFINRIRFLSGKDAEDKGPKDSSLASGRPTVQIQFVAN